MNNEVNQGILTSFREGVLTSTSLLANAPCALAACKEWNLLVSQQMAGNLRSSGIRRDLSDSDLRFDFGIHLNLTQGRPLSVDRFPAELLDSQGNFPGIGPLFHRLRRVRSQPLSAVVNELSSQIEWMCDNGHRPTHLNGHQYIEMIPQISAVIPELMQKYGIPVVRVARESGLVRSVLLQGRLRDFAIGLVKRYYANAFRRRLKISKFTFPDRYFGTAHAGRINLSVLKAYFGAATNRGMTEIGVHPGINCDAPELDSKDSWIDPLRPLRPAEVDCLCSSMLPELMVSHGLRLGRLQSIGEPLHQ